MIFFSNIIESTSVLIFSCVYNGFYYYHCYYLKGTTLINQTVIFKDPFEIKHGRKHYGRLQLTMILSPYFLKLIFPGCLAAYFPEN